MKRVYRGIVLFGAAGDASILQSREGEFEYAEMLGETVCSTQRLFGQGRSYASESTASAFL